MNSADNVEKAIIEMQESLRQLLMQHREENWQQQANIKVAEILNGDKEKKEFGEQLIHFLTSHLNCFGGTFYTLEEENKLSLQYALGVRDSINREITADQSYFAGALRKKTCTTIDQIESQHFNVNSSLLKSDKVSMVIIPLHFNETISGVIELARFSSFSESELRFVESNRKPIAIYLNTIVSKEKLENLLDTLDSKEQELQNRINAINKSTLMVEYDPKGTIISANDLFLKLTGYELEELIGQHHSIFAINKHAYQEETQEFWGTLNTGNSHQGEYLIKSKSEQALWLQASYTPVSNKQGHIYKIIEIGYDITLLKSQQAKIEEISLSHQHQIEVLNKAAILSETDAEGNISYVNDLFCQISGYERAELIGKNHRMLKSGKQPDGIFVGMWKAIKMGLTWQGEILNKRKDGTYYWVDSTITPFRNKAGEIEKFVAIRFDITNQKESEALKKQTEALLQTQKELEEANTELEAQSQKLQASEEELRVQQEELMQSNKELDEKTKLLSEKNVSIDLKNKDLTLATEALIKKSKELELSSKYKSEFLANMSHELRTPLNSIILLSRLMTENTDNNLTEDQLEYSTVINKAGNNLLELINDILDLSKIESGKMDIDPEEIILDDFRQDIEKLFLAVSKEKNIEFSIHLSKNCPERILTDKMKLGQVIKNLLSNAFKFAPGGKVTLLIEVGPDDMISFMVSDNGIGIPEDKQALIFEAFKQADGSTKRKYGGTGLGLSISKEIAHLLGGTIRLESKPGEGSRFILNIPVQYKEGSNTKAAGAESPGITVHEKAGLSPSPKRKQEVVEVNLDDDRKSIHVKDKVILVVEDDLILAKTYLTEARNKGFKVLVALNGNDAVILAKKYHPTGIILDINLPYKNGWEVLKELKEFAETKDIPVQIVSSENIKAKEVSEAGAVGISPKPLTQEAIHHILGSLNVIAQDISGGILVVSDKNEHRIAMNNYLEDQGIKTDNLDLSTDIDHQLSGMNPTVVILDISFRKIKISEILKALSKHYSGKSLSVIILSSSYLSSVEQKRLEDYKQDFNIRIARNYSSVVAEIGLFFNYLTSSKKQKKLRPPIQNSKILKNRKIMIVDDDGQNLLSIRKLLEMNHAVVMEAKNGLEALEKFKSEDNIDAIIMDIMMPVMDGYEAIQAIRELPQGKTIPIITLTAKSQPEEREKCLLNGSSDFVTKPVDGDQLIRLIKVWLTQPNP